MHSLLAICNFRNPKTNEMHLQLLLSSQPNPMIQERSRSCWKFDCKCELCVLVWSMLHVCVCCGEREGKRREKREV